MKRLVILALAAACVALAQTETKHIMLSGGGPGFLPGEPGSTVQRAPYSATIVNESTQTLVDGNRIVQRSTGTIARDAQGRTRQDTALPPIGNMSAANAPHLVFIQDPVAQTAYTLNLTDKTAHKMFSTTSDVVSKGMTSASFAQPAMRVSSGSVSAAIPSGGVFFQKTVNMNEQAEVRTENLGTQNMQGVSVEGVRTTRTIAAGEIGNDRAIDIVTEVWTSPELKTIVSSKRSDPRMGDQTFQLTNIVRSDPDASLFAVPADFKLLEGPDTKGNFVYYRANE